MSCGGGSGGNGNDTNGVFTTTNHAPTAVIGTSVINGLYVTFDAIGSSDPDGDPLTFNWDFGDGDTGYGRVCTHTYTAPGVYTVAMSVSDGRLSDIATHTITVDQSAGAFPQPFDFDAVYVEDIYVALPPTGSDSSGNGSLAAPFATIRHALSQAASGSRIRVQAGTYGAIGSVADVHGTETHPILVTTDGQVVIDAGGTGSGMQISNASFLVIEGLIFQNTGIHGLNIDDGSDYATPSHHIVFRNVSFRNIGSGGNNDCLKMSGVDDFYITGCEFQECDRGEAIDMVGCHNGVITGNFFHDVVQNGVQTKGGSADVLIHGNRFEDIPQRAINAGGSTGSPYFRPLNAEYEAARIQMVGNTFLRTGSTPVAFVGCDTCVFANNTIIEPLSYVARILEENTSRTAGHDGYFINNLLVFNTADINSWSYVNVGPNTRPDTFIFGWNLWYALDDPNFSGPVYQGGLPAESNAVIQQDPLLTNLAAGDYHIMQGSPAQGVGRSVPRGVVADFDYAPFNDPPSIGAYEVQ
jgi:PKD repeat protein